MKMKNTNIERREWNNHLFSFLRNQGISDSDYRETIKGGVVYIHSWGTGYEELIYKDHDAATRWWDTNVKNNFYAGKPA